MIIYNVTIAVNPEVEEDFISWLKNTHIQEVMETGLFLRSEIFKVFESPHAEKHNSYAVQYRLESWEKFNTYQSTHATALQQKTKDRYGENVLAFRTFLESQ